MSANVEIVIDCQDPEHLAPFWVEVLGYRLDGVIGAYHSIVPVDGSGPRIIFQRVPEPKVGKSRAHLDVEVLDVEDEARRLEALGTTRLGEIHQIEHDSRWIVLADPEGNELCLFTPLP